MIANDDTDENNANDKMMNKTNTKTDENKKMLQTDETQTNMMKVMCMMKIKNMMKLLKKKGTHEMMDMMKKTKDEYKENDANEEADDHGKMMNM